MVVNSPFLTGQLLLKQWLRPPTPIKSMENHYNLKKRKNEKWARPDWLALPARAALVIDSRSHRDSATLQNLFM
jgi:hypothetical protein